MNHLLRISTLTCLTAAAGAQSFNWTLETPAASPTQRERVLTGTDGTLYYMYGGQSGASTVGLDELWTYDGLTWTQQSTSNLSAGTRCGGVGAYDAARGKFVVFGGKVGFASGDPLLNDTWEWDAVNGWVQVVTATSPDRRWLVSNGVYVPGLGVMFHGGFSWDANGASYRSNETWLYTGADWVPVSSSGPRGQNMNMVYRAAENDLLLHGGQYYDASNASLGTLGQTWSFDLSTFSWTQLTPLTTPYNSSNVAQGLFAAMAYYNPLTGNVVVHGGNGGSSSNLTWEFDGTDWKDVSSNGVGCRNGGMHWVDALQKGVYGPCNESNGTRNRTRTHGPQSWGGLALTGTDCPVSSSGVTASMATSSMPAINQTLDINLTDLTVTNVPIIALGVAAQAAPIPMGFIFAGSGAGCTVQVDASLISVGATLSVPVPNVSALVGQVIYAQGVQLDLNLTAANTKLGELTFGEF
jgi:hypothetical protein